MSRYDTDWAATSDAYRILDADQIEALSRPRFARPDVEPFEPVPHYPGTAALMLIAMCFTIPLAIYGAIHAGRAVMMWWLQ